MDWIQSLSFSDLFIALSALVTLIGAYLNLNYKLDSVMSKTLEMEKNYEMLSREMESISTQQRGDLSVVKAQIDNKLSIVEDRLRIADVFMGRVDEKMTYVTEQLKQIATIIEKSKA